MKDRTDKSLSYQDILDKILIRLKTILLEFWLMVLRWVGYIPLHSIRKIIYIISGVQIPLFGSTIHMWANFFNPKNVSIGKDTIIGDHCFLDGRAPLKIGDHVGIASQVLIYNDEHNINSSDYSNSFGPVTIGDYVFIGPRSIILPGITIGKGAVVAAGAVVTKDIPEFEIWGGVPAKKIGDRNKNLNYKLGRPMLFQ
ncbi:MAG: acyltransferase [Candidatus Shapirobacteria bacterium]|nr:acyltransferase [Candidatus Shapirobacteria bacterium]